MKYSKYWLFTTVLFLVTLLSYSQKIKGRITGESGQPLPFSSVLIKGTTGGVSANADGYYTIDAAPGTYTLIAEHVGYISSELQVTVTIADATINFSLPLQQYNLNNVTVTSGGEDPAYGIIRQAIKKRSQYEHEVKQLQCDVYIKGRLQVDTFPDRIFGKKVDLPGRDTMKHQTLFLSETNARWSVQAPDNEKVEVLSTRVSGTSGGYGLSSPQIISFYKNNVSIGENLNPRGFVSPIADDALSFYKYKLDGTFYDNGLLINHIRVIPKGKYEPVFAGYINIIEGNWRIYSVDLSIQKDQQMQYLDKLSINQVYLPVDSIWLVKQQVIYPTFNLLGFSGYGNFVQVYSNFNRQPEFAKNFFNNIIVKYPDSATKKPVTFWDSTRPLPLLPIEIADYKHKDSLETVHQSAPYLDSVDRVINRVKPVQLLISGQTFTNSKKKTTYVIDGIINSVSYNTVEGANIIFSPDFTKKWTKNRQSLFISPTLRYGFHNEHFNAHLTSIYTYGKQYQTSLYVSGGRRVFQVNNDQPITAFSNAVSTLIFKSNYMKIYEAPFGRVSFTKEVPGGVVLTAYGEYQDRIPLENTTDWTIFNGKFLGVINNYGRTFSPNYPTNLAASNFQRHQAAIVSLGIKWQPGSKYIEFPDRIISIGSSYPTFSASYTQGIHDLFGSDVNYSKWKLNARDDVKLGLAGSISYNASIGGFINKKVLFTPDYQHYYGNRNTVVSDYINTFLLAGFYELSNTAPFYTEAHVEYHLNGLLTNKIPLLKKWNWFFVVGGNTLLFQNRQYAEYYFSIENIAKVLRIDFVESYDPQKNNTSGIRLSLLNLLASKKED